MGGAIAKVAFQPPNQATSRQMLEGKIKSGEVQFVDSVNGDKIAYMRFPGNRGGAASSTGGLNNLVVLYSHGNAEDLAYGHQSYAAMAQQLGVEVYAYDYPGYAASAAVSPSEEGALAAADAMLQLLTAKMQIPRTQIVIMGRSLGSGIATNLASRNPGCAGLILVAPLRSCAAVAGKTAAFFAYPVDLFPNIRIISSIITYPVHLFHGDVDEVVPYQHGCDLFAEIQKTNPHSYFTTLKGAGHNNIEQLRGREFFDGLRDFLAKAPERCRDLKTKLLLKKKEDEEEDSVGCMSSSSIRK